MFENNSQKSGYFKDSDKLSLVNQLGKEFISSLDFKTVVRRVLTRVKSILNCEASSLLIFDELSNHLRFFGVSGKGEDVLKDLQIPYGKGIAWWSFINGKNIIVNDVSRDERFYSDVDKVTGLITRNVICVPIIKNNRKLGVIEGINNLSGNFTEDDLELLETISQFVALSIDNSMVHQRLEEKNIELKSANDDLHEFIKVISHDLQTPLSSIKGYIDLLMEELKLNKIRNNTIEGFINRIQLNIADILNFIRDLLDFVEMKRKDLIVNNFNPISALEEIINMEEEKYYAGNIILELNGTIKNIEFDQNLFFRLIKLVVQNYFKIFKDLKSIKIRLECNSDEYINFKIIPQPINPATDNIWLKNMINVEISYLAKVFSILGGKIFTRPSLQEDGKLEFRIPVSKDGGTHKE